MFPTLDTSSTYIACSYFSAIFNTFNINRCFLKKGEDKSLLKTFCLELNFKHANNIRIDFLLEYDQLLLNTPIPTASSVSICILHLSTKYSAARYKSIARISIDKWRHPEENSGRISPNFLTTIFPNELWVFLEIQKLMILTLSEASKADDLRLLSTIQKLNYLWLFSRLQTIVISNPLGFKCWSSALFETGQLLTLLAASKLMIFGSSESFKSWWSSTTSYGGSKSWWSFALLGSQKMNIFRFSWSFKNWWSLALSNVSKSYILRLRSRFLKSMIFGYSRSSKSWWS